MQQQQILTQQAQKPSSFQFFFLKKKTEEKRKGTPPALIITRLKRVCIVLPGAKFSPTFPRPGVHPSNILVSTFFHNYPSDSYI